MISFKLFSDMPVWQEWQLLLKTVVRGVSIALVASCSIVVIVRCSIMTVNNE